MKEKVTSPSVTSCRLPFVSPWDPCTATYSLHHEKVGLAD